MKPEKLKERYLKEDEREINAAFASLLQHSHGRKALWWLLEISGVGRQPFMPNALQMSFACGELNVGNRVLERITSVSPDGYVTMMKEKADERRNRDAELERAGRSDPELGQREHPEPEWERAEPE